MKFPCGNSQEEAWDVVRTQLYVVREAQRETSASVKAVYGGLVVAADLLQPSSATSGRHNTEQLENAQTAGP